MQFAVLMSICILILAVTTALDAPCARVNVTPFGATFMALCVIALSRFVLEPCPEFRINGAAGFLPVFFLFGTIFKRGRALEKSSILLLFTSVAYSASLAIVKDANPALLLCIGSALVAAFLHESPLFSMFVASLVPLIGPVFYACYELYAFGYASCNLGAAYVLDAQLVGVISTTVAAYLFGVRSAQPENT